MIFVNTVHPYLRILLPDGAYAQFLGGRLELDPGDDGFETVKAEAERNPSISIIVNSTTCELCGEVFTGKTAKALFTKHAKAIHPLTYDAEQALAHAKSLEKTLKERAGYACDICAPVQTFGSEADLAEHVRELHTQPPETDAEGNDVGEGRRPGEAAIPAAKPSNS